MYIFVSQMCWIDDGGDVVDFGQQLVDIFFFFVVDMEFGSFVVVYVFLGKDKCSLRFVNLMVLLYFYFVDFYVEQMVCGFRLVILCIFGGVEYWCYGLEWFFEEVCGQGIDLIVVLGDDKWDEMFIGYLMWLVDEVYCIWCYCVEGGGQNYVNVLCYVVYLIGQGEELVVLVLLLWVGIYMFGDVVLVLEDLRVIWCNFDVLVVVIIFYWVLVQGF